MARFRLTNKAKTDLRKIGRDTEKQWGREQRNTYLEKLDGSFHLLADNPGMAKACPEVGQGYRYHHVGRHFIFYRQLEHPFIQIEIVRILHDRMDYLQHLVVDDA